MLACIIIVSNLDRNILSACKEAAEGLDLCDNYVPSGHALAAMGEHLFTAGVGRVGLKVCADLQERRVDMQECLAAFAVPTCGETGMTAIVEAFKLKGLTFIITKPGGFIFDRAHLNQLHECCARVASYREFSSTYRVSGAGDVDRTAIRCSICSLESAMAASITPKFPSGSPKLAGAMKHGRTMLLNMTSPDNKYDTGEAERMALLLEEYEEKREGPTDWLAIMRSLPVSSVIALDLVNI